MIIYDISIEIKNDMIIYPGDPAVSILSHKKIPEDSSNVSKISIGSHTGTHIDAILHVFENGAPTESYELNNFFGKAKVLDLTHVQFGEVIEKKDLIKYEILPGDRILLKTLNSDRGFEKFFDDFVAISGDSAEYLASKKIALLGIDSLSVKKRGTKDNRAHTELLKNNIPILETIDLSKIREGEYDICCFPIKIKNVDGAPVRAVLIDNK